jgi:hypothetical protein
MTSSSSTGKASSPIKPSSTYDNDDGDDDGDGDDDDGDNIGDYHDDGDDNDNIYREGIISYIAIFNLCRIYMYCYY